MDIEDRNKFIEPMENFERDVKDRSGNKALVNWDVQGQLILDAEGISLEIIRKIQDKKMEIDLEFEKTRDLYEKQRVLDPYLD